MTAATETEVVLQEETSERVPHWYCGPCNGFNGEWPDRGWVVLVAYCRMSNPVELDNPAAPWEGPFCAKCISLEETYRPRCPEGHEVNRV